jgi:hypothetical protein
MSALMVLHEMMTPMLDTLHCVAGVLIMIALVALSSGRAARRIAARLLCPVAGHRFEDDGTWAGFVWRLALAASILLQCGQLRAEDPAAAGIMETDANLVTGLDVSSSVNAQETLLQVEGLALAIRSPAVLDAIRNGEQGRIGFAVFVWADGDYPTLVSWRAIGSEAEAEAAAAEILASLQALIDSSARSVGTLTNLSGAIDHAAQLLAAAPFRARRTLANIVGNGEDNVGEDPSRARAALLAAGATINGVVVGGDPAVLNYYRNQVIGGRTAFVLPADSAGDLAQAFALKFVREIAMQGEVRPGQ